MKKLMTAICFLEIFCSCDMDLYRTDTMTSSQLKDDPGAADYTTAGNYALFKDIMTVNGATYSGDSYIRHYFQMSEFRGDNICLSGSTTDPLYEATRYTDDPTKTNLSRLWFQAYRIIYGANANIEGIVTGASVESDHMKGENYFLRAIVHLHLVTLYAKPISCGLDNPGIVLRTSTDCSTTTRATIGEVYEQIEADLKQAIELMSAGTSRGDKSFVSKEAAQGLLTRVYLYEGKNQECVDLANEMLGNDPSVWLDTDIADYYINAKTSKETLWCVAVEAKDLTDKQSSIASMYYTYDGVGWGEIYYSDPLIELYERYPQDLRFTSFCELSDPAGDGSKMVYWPIINGDNDFYVNAMVSSGVTDNGDGTYTFTYDSKSYTTSCGTENTYPVNYIIYNGQKTKVYVRDAAKSVGIRETHPKYFMKKFSWQDGEAMISSPVMIRYAEVILNRAEANAKLGNDAKAIEDVNVIRTRAGLTGDAQMSLANYASRGYADVLDVVLDERRLELCFEGHRAIDVFRNSKSLDRQYSGVHPWEIINYDDPKIPYYIPMDEVSVSGIAQNKK